VIACAVAATIDAATPDGSAIPAELRPARELVDYLAGVPVRVADALVPASDVIPAPALSAIVTDRGVVAPVDREALAAHMGWADAAAATPPDGVAPPEGVSPPAEPDGEPDPSLAEGDA
jgi:hypothetical protein